jgi:Zn-dependent protease
MPFVDSRNNLETSSSEPAVSLGTREREPGALKKLFGPLAIAAFFAVKFFAKIKFLLPVILKSGGSMILMIGVYASLWGWKWGLGFVVLLLLHECGHLIVAKYFGLKVSAPMFIPFMGAFIALKEAPRNAWIEACVGIGGPLLGSAAALVCHLIGASFNAPLFIALAWSAYFLNLFNLTPVGVLDGGRIATALSPWLWVPGLGLLAWLGWSLPHNIIIWLVLIMSLPRVFSLFRKRTEEEKRFYEVAPAQRWQMAGMYFGLIAALVFGMYSALAHLDQRGVNLSRTGVRSQSQRTGTLVQ